jgi:hypothetical protein
MSEEVEDFFEMANLFPADTGLPMVVWASERGHARHDVRVEVNQSHGTRMLPETLQCSPCARCRGWSPAICLRPISAPSATGFG